MGVVVKRFAVYLIVLDPTRGSEIKKTRPCVIVSPDEMNQHLNTVIVAPMTTTRKDYPSRVVCEFQEKQGSIVLDQLRTVDKARLLKPLGSLSSEGQTKILATLRAIFAE